MSDFNVVLPGRALTKSAHVSATSPVIDGCLLAVSPVAGAAAVDGLDKSPERRESKGVKHILSSLLYTSDHVHIQMPLYVSTVVRLLLLIAGWCSRTAVHLYM